MNNNSLHNKKIIQLNKLDETKKKTFVSRTWISFLVFFYYVTIVIFCFFSDNSKINSDVLKWPVINPQIKSIFAFIYILLIYIPFVFAIYEVNKLVIGKNNKTFIPLLLTSSILFLAPNIFYILLDYFDINIIENNFFQINNINVDINKNRDLTKLRLFFGTIFAGMLTTILATNICCVLTKKNNAMNVITLNFLMFIVPFGFTSFAIVGLIRSWVTLLYLFLSVVLVDASCYIVGIFFGKTPMAPVISPNKTKEGAIGGSIVSIILTLVFCALLEIYKSPDGKTNPIIQMVAIIHSDFSIYNWIWIVCTTISIVLISITGDLFFSYVKRKYNIKDYGNILKSHGGILDRVDSQIFVSSTYAILLFIVSSMVNWSLL